MPDAECLQGIDLQGIFLQCVGFQGADCLACASHQVGRAVGVSRKSKPVGAVAPLPGVAPPRPQLSLTTL